MTPFCKYEIDAAGLSQPPENKVRHTNVQLDLAPIDLNTPPMVFSSLH